MEVTLFEAVDLDLEEHRFGMHNFICQVTEPADIAYLLIAATFDLFNKLDHLHFSLNDPLDDQRHLDDPFNYCLDRHNLLHNPFDLNYMRYKYSALRCPFLYNCNVFYRFTCSIRRGVDRATIFAVVLHVFSTIR
jgi:hypothetical protein